MELLFWKTNKESIEVVDGYGSYQRYDFIVKIGKIWTPEKVAVIFLELGQCGFTTEKCIQKMQTEWQIMDPDQTADLGLHCLPRPVNL